MTIHTCKQMCSVASLLIATSCGGDSGENIPCPVRCDASGFSLSCESGDASMNNVTCTTLPQQGTSTCDGPITYTDTGKSYQCTWTLTLSTLRASCDGHGSCSYP
jgi:hypothetical protein